MTFEEFFKKKRIDLVALGKAEPALFSEFKTYFEQMGEKSFDHTKKYWFNKLRRQFYLMPEGKTEKSDSANPLAGQTIMDSLLKTAIEEKNTDANISAPKLVYKPRFNVKNIPPKAAE